MRAQSDVAHEVFGAGTVDRSNLFNEVAVFVDGLIDIVQDIGQTGA